MRYKKGSIVEVSRKNEVPPGSWCCAEIICGNGHNYTVRYEMDAGAFGEAIIERVSRKSIRPCPPPVELSNNWFPGDVIEVLLNFSWKMATVSKVLRRNYFLVRLLGSSHEIKVNKFDLRMRQSWQGDKWFVIGKSIRNCEDRKNSEGTTLKYNQKLSSQVKKIDTWMNFHVKDEHNADKNNNNFQESHIASSRTLQRELSNCYYSEVQAPARTAQKFRAIEQEDWYHHFLAANPSPVPEKVDAVASHREMLGEKDVYTSFNRATHFTEVNVEREKPSGAVGCSLANSLGPNDADNITCSVASCSITSNGSFKFQCNNIWEGPVEGTEGNFSDAESVYHWGFEEGNCFHPTQEELEAEIHRLELHAYCCTMEALHAWGPLSWERETLVTDLRLSLHISNDEHLMELRSLVSTDSSMPLR